MTPREAVAAASVFLAAASVFLAAATTLAACAADQPPPEPPAVRTAPDQCLLPGEQPMLVAELFFGRDIPGKRPVSDTQWRDFADAVVTPNFPDGFTVFDAEGQWRDPATGAISREPTRVLLVAAKRAADLQGRIITVIDAYKKRFRQKSVGVITRDSCAAF